MSRRQGRNCIALFLSESPTRVNPLPLVSVFMLRRENEIASFSSFQRHSRACYSISSGLNIHGRGRTDPRALSIPPRLSLQFKAAVRKPAFVPLSVTLSLRPSKTLHIFRTSLTGNLVWKCLVSFAKWNFTLRSLSLGYLRLRHPRAEGDSMPSSSCYRMET